jgi:hypothetical protein
VYTKDDDACTAWIDLLDCRNFPIGVRCLSKLGRFIALKNGNSRVNNIMRKSTSDNPSTGPYSELPVNVPPPIPSVIRDPTKSPSGSGETSSATGANPDPISPELLLELHNNFRSMRHRACNTLAVIMALSEMAERNPSYVKKLTEMVLSKSPELVEDLQQFDEEFRALLKRVPE